MFINWGAFPSIMETTTLRVTLDLKSKLDPLKLVPNETYDHLLKRLLKIK